MSEKQVRDYDKFMLRFPDGMREAIAERAKANGRSMNSEIVQILQDALERRVVDSQAQLSDSAKVALRQHIDRMVELLKDSDDKKPT